MAHLGIMVCGQAPGPGQVMPFLLQITRGPRDGPWWRAQVLLVMPGQRLFLPCLMAAKKAKRTAFVKLLGTVKPGTGSTVSYLIGT